MNQDLFAFLTPAPIELFGGGPDPRDVKLGSVARRVLSPADMTGVRVAVLGFPVDDGVRRNHGRPGAASAPGAIRRVLYRLNAADAFRRRVSRNVVGDFGNILPGATLEESQSRAIAVLTALLRDGLTVVLLGGGHETARVHVEALLALGERQLVCNVDPHLDVRESADNRPTSGNPFRLGLEAAQGAMRYVVVGARAEANAHAYAEYVLTQGGAIHWSDGASGFPAARIVAEELAAAGEAVAGVSLDIDAVESGAAPGSSAAAPVGLAPHEFIRCAREGGRCRRVRVLEVSECAPPYDRDGQTARLAALAVQGFLIERCGAD